MRLMSLGTVSIALKNRKDANKSTDISCANVKIHNRHNFNITCTGYICRMNNRTTYYMLYLLLKKKKPLIRVLSTKYKTYERKANYIPVVVAFAEVYVVAAALAAAGRRALEEERFVSGARAEWAPRKKKKKIINHYSLREKAFVVAPVLFFTCCCWYSCGFTPGGAAYCADDL